MLKFQVDRFAVMRKEKELSLKTESVDALKNPIDNTDSTIQELEHKLQQYINENNELEIKMEEAVQDSGKFSYKYRINLLYVNYFTKSVIFTRGKTLKKSFFLALTGMLWNLKRLLKSKMERQSLIFLKLRYVVSYLYMGILVICCRNPFKHAPFNIFFTG